MENPDLACPIGAGTTLCPSFRKQFELKVDVFLGQPCGMGAECFDGPALIGQSLRQLHNDFHVADLRLITRLTISPLCEI